MDTKVVKLDLLATALNESLEQQILNQSDNMLNAGYGLRGCFESCGQLVLIYQPLQPLAGA